MKNLKLNQLNRQKMSEREMNVIEGGALPPGSCGVVPGQVVHPLSAEFSSWEALACGACYDTTYGPGYSPNHDKHSQLGFEFRD